MNAPIKNAPPEGTRFSGAVESYTIQIGRGSSGAGGNAIHSGNRSRCDGNQAETRTSARQDDDVPIAETEAESVANKREQHGIKADAQNLQSARQQRIAAATRTNPTVPTSRLGVRHLYRAFCTQSLEIVGLV